MAEEIFSDEEKKFYEIGYLLRPNLREADAENKKDYLMNLIGGLGGDSVLSPSCRKQKLAYPIKKQTSAYFGYLLMEIFPSKLAEIKEKIRYDGDILRYIVLGRNKKIFERAKQKEEEEKKEKAERAGKVPGAPEKGVRPEDRAPREEPVSEKQEIPKQAPAFEKEIDLNELDKRLKEILE